ncbi:hypothetical protein E2C01_046804 [Portunus trituberculatus]|uniref:Uncharacterized protein n=1 Tax=Portunus trituberculatus TaxID=210409 RepID=A0A5B7G6N9_PORTR|nr:hypothetical protein [Portunus trituberculatus]
MPFSFKRQVFEVAMNGTLLYSTETWLTNDTKRLKAQYNAPVRSLLGVRHNTSIDLCLVEAGTYPVEDKIVKRRVDFLKTKLQIENSNKPLYQIYELCRQANTPVFLPLSLRKKKYYNDYYY